MQNQYGILEQMEDIIDVNVVKDRLIIFTNKLIQNVTECKQC